MSGDFFFLKCINIQDILIKSFNRKNNDKPLQYMYVMEMAFMYCSGFFL